MKKNNDVKCDQCGKKINKKYMQNHFGYTFCCKECAKKFLEENIK